MPIDDIDNDEISSLWQEDPMDPLALIAPNAEEVVISLLCCLYWHRKIL
jgi:PERQ amino acid-rich with GYF domain-containing protein